MSMTREEARKQLEELFEYCEIMKVDGEIQTWERDCEAIEMAISALRPITREQVEKVWRGCSWCNNEGKKPENWECSLLDDRGFSVVVGDEVVWTNAEFCPVCGKPLTDEAVDMVMERINKMEETGDGLG